MKFILEYKNYYKEGDIVLCPNGEGRYFVGQLTGSYSYAPGTNLPHRRPVDWFDQMIDRPDMSEALRNSTGSIGTVSNIDRYAEEIERLIGGHISLPVTPSLSSTDPTVEDPTIFALEKHLEDFLVHNWPQTELGKEFDQTVHAHTLDGRRGVRPAADGQNLPGPRLANG